MNLHNENASIELAVHADATQDSSFIPDFTSDDVGTDGSFIEAAPAEASDAADGFAALNLNPALLQAVQALGYTQPTGVQAETIPAALAGGDWMVSAQTGSGKTAAFLLPALHALLETPAMSKGEQAARSRRAGASPRVLVLCPTRELAQQVSAEAISLVRFCRGIRIANVVGGTPFGKQLMELRGANLVVATPGRLLDLNRNGQIDLDCVQTLVVDEADRMLDLGFSEDLEAIHAATARRERTLMFSATFAPRIMQLASNVMRDPKRIELASAQDTHQNIEQRLHWFDDMSHKNELLEHYLQDETMGQAVVFTATQIETDELADQLRESGYSAAGLHGAMPQVVRNRRLKSLRDGTTKILIATDVAARGIDVPGITHVINYGLPMKPEDYIHRIGRTGRAGRQGLAITLAGFRDRFKIRNIERFTQQPIDEAVVEGHEPRTQIRKPQGGGYGASNGGGYGGNGGGYGGNARFDRSNDRPAPRSYDNAAPQAPRAPREFNDAPRPAFADRGDRSDRSAAPSRPFAREERGGFEDRAPRFHSGGNDRGFPRADARSDDRRPSFGGDRARPADSRFGAPRTEFAPRPNAGFAGREDRRPAFGDRAPRPFADRESRPFGGERDNRSFGDRAPRPFGGDRDQRAAFGAPAGGRPEYAPRPRFDRESSDRAPRTEYAPRAERTDFAPRAEFAAPRAERDFGHDQRATRRGDRPAGPAITPPADGGNRAARRAAKQAEYAAKVAAQGGE
ncbi:MAG: DEAD/DEAH box helicase [Casimicrobium sp.]